MPEAEASFLVLLVSGGHRPSGDQLPLMRTEAAHGSAPPLASALEIPDRSVLTTGPRLVEW